MTALRLAFPEANLSGQQKPMLNTFRLRYTDGDHRVASVGVTDLTDSNIKKIHLMPNKDETAYQVDFRDDSTFEYEVTIQYGWFAAGSGGDGAQVLTGHRLWGKRNSVIRMTKSSSSTASVLRGFSFQFLNGDHYLKDIAVEQDSKRQYKVRFNDKNYDDPVMAQLDIVFLG